MSLQIRYGVFIFFIVHFFSCTQEKKEDLKTNNIEYYKPLYAKNFSVEKNNTYTIFKTFHAWNNNTDSFEFLINHKKNIQRIVCLSSTQVGALALLNKQHTVCGISSIQHIYDAEIHRLFQQKKIIEVGDMNLITIERIASLKPDIVLIYGLDASMKNTLKKLQELQIPALPISEYTEHSALAQAEWIMLYGLLLDDSTKAANHFSKVEKEYTAQQTSGNKKVVLNLAWKNTWYMPGKYSLQGNLLADAGVDTSLLPAVEGSVPESFEKIVSSFHDAEIWLNPSNCNTLDCIKETEKNAMLFTAYTKKNIYNNTKRIHPNGANDYWESGIYFPNLVLQDLKNILQNKNITADSLHYYQKLE